VLIVVALGLVLALFLARTITKSNPRTTSSGSVKPPEVSLPDGEWTARGTVREADHSADFHAGSVKVRPWTFTKVCAATCHIMFLRQTLYGPSETEVVPHDGYYTAAFPPVTTPCVHYPGEYAGTSASYDTYRLQWADNGEKLVASSTERGSGPDCPGFTAETWVATRNNPNAPGP
jgi:hypothetical protein